MFLLFSNAHEIFVKRLASVLMLFSGGGSVFLFHVSKFLCQPSNHVGGFLQIPSSGFFQN